MSNSSKSAARAANAQNGNTARPSYKTLGRVEHGPTSSRIVLKQGFGRKGGRYEQILFVIDNSYMDYKKSEVVSSKIYLPLGKVPVVEELLSIYKTLPTQHSGEHEENA